MLVRMMTVWLYFDQFERELVVKNEKGSRPESSLLDAMDYPGLSRRPSMMTRRCSEGRDLRFFFTYSFPVISLAKVISTNQTRAYNVLQQPDFKSINFLSAEAFVTPAPEKLPLVD